MVFGEVLYDCFPEYEVLGGAPFNVAWALSAFGVDCRLLSAVGADARGQRILKELESWGIPADYIAIHDHLPTGRVCVELQKGEPSYLIEQPSAWDWIDAEALRASRFIYHGSLALRDKANQKSLSDLIRRGSTTRFFDLNLREPFDDLCLVEEWLMGAAWVKLNLDELRLLLSKPSIVFEHSQTEVQELRARFGIGNVILTAGAEGAMICTALETFIRTPAPHVAGFVDAVGAGDAFAAIVITGILQSWDLRFILDKASLFAASVCGIRGATSKDKQFYRNG